MSGGVSRFTFPIWQGRNRLKYPPVTKILSRIVIRQTLPMCEILNPQDLQSKGDISADQGKILGVKGDHPGSYASGA